MKPSGKHFLDEQSRYYSPKHRDDLYQTIQDPIPVKTDSGSLWYFRLKKIQWYKLVPGLWGLRRQLFGTDNRDVIGSSCF